MANWRLGVAGASELGDTTYIYDGVYPATALTRLTSLTHVYDRINSIYRLTINMGGLSQMGMAYTETYNPAPPTTPQPTGETPITPPTPPGEGGPGGQGGQTPDYGVYYPTPYTNEFGIEVRPAPMPNAPPDYGVTYPAPYDNEYGIEVRPPPIPPAPFPEPDYGVIYTDPFIDQYGIERRPAPKPPPMP